MTYSCFATKINMDFAASMLVLGHHNKKMKREFMFRHI